MDHSLDIRRLLDEKRLGVRLEPVISIRQKSVIGHEFRVAPWEGVPGADLRARAVQQGLAVGFDRWARRAGLEAFRGVAGDRGLFFLGFDTAVLDMGVAGSGHVAEVIKEFGLSPSEVVIGIRESKVDDLEALKNFVAHYRALGFLIALKGVGEGHSNLERLAFVRPDMLKLGEGLVAGLEKEFFRQEIVKSLVGLSRKIGTLVVAEGVDDEAQALTALDLGVDMLQGGYWRADAEGPELAKRVDALAARHKAFSVEKTRSTGQRLRAAETLLGRLVKTVAGLSPQAMERELNAFAAEDPSVECLFVLNDRGIQVTETVSRPGTVFKQSALFSPARKGADHSLKEYFYLLGDTFVTRYRTEPYVSLASGHPCVTLSAMFRDGSNLPHILCVDVPWD